MILQNLPPGTERIRQNILEQIQQGLQVDSRREENNPDRQKIEIREQGPSPIPENYTLVQVLATKPCISMIIDSGRMQGKDKPSPVV
mmetsp:Transcript_39225/g.59828  ORF Transcript_39225/g.59828 Transcript_39225/m.59828 type:complete len:87 (+) Transcript_39225:533-793(+)